MNEKKNPLAESPIRIVIHMKSEDGALNQSLIFGNVKSLSIETDPHRSRPVFGTWIDDTCIPRIDYTAVSLDFDAYNALDLDAGYLIYNHNQIENDEEYDLSEFLGIFSEEQVYNMAKNYVEDFEAREVDSLLDERESLVIEKLRKRGYAVYANEYPDEV